MIELIATSVITISSALLFGYWFRYTCLLILSAKTTRDYACEVAAANQLSFTAVQSQLRAAAHADLDVLHQLLDRDYSLLTFLFRNAESAGEQGLENHILQANYRLMAVWFQVSRRFSPVAARKALE